MKFVQFAFLLIIITDTGVVFQSSSKDFEEALDSQKSQIEELKKEIEKTKNRIKEENKKESSITKKVIGLEKEIFLINRLLIEVKKEKEAIVKTILVLDREEEILREEGISLDEKLLQTEGELSFLKNRYSRRVVHSYKKGSLSIIEKILSSTSWRQSIYRSHYLYLISEVESRDKSRLKVLLERIKNQKEGLANILQKKRLLKLKQNTALLKAEEIKTEHIRQKDSLNQKKQSRAKELKKIRMNKTELERYKKEKQEGLKKLELVRKKILQDKSRFERAERIRMQQSLLKSKTFSQVKGKLPWPADGKIVTRFGKQKNPELKTITESLGIDIKGALGSPIQAVLGGIITTITYIRGYGTMIIIDHGGDYYTVYSHVTDIQISIDSEVEGGDIIAYMGDSGSLMGAMLHFEIWGKNQKLNPEEWLQKK